MKKIEKLVGKHEKIHYDYSSYFCFDYKCKQCGLGYPAKELQENGLCFICNEENKKINEILAKIYILNNKIKFKKISRSK